MLRPYRRTGAHGRAFGGKLAVFSCVLVTSHTASHGILFECITAYATSWVSTWPWQVLATLAKTFPLFAPTDTLMRDCLVVFAIGVVYKLIFVFLFISGTANASRTVPAEERQLKTGPEAA